MPPASASHSSAARSSASRPSRVTPSIASTRPSAAPDRIAPSRFWRSGTACQPTMISSATACATWSRSSGATARTNASAVPHESSTSPSPTAPAPTAALRWSWPPTASTAPRASGSASPTPPSGVPPATGSGSIPAGAPDQASVSSHHARACRSSEPVRDASDSSAAWSPPSPWTTQSPTLSQRTPRSVSGTWSRSQRYFATVRSARGDNPVIVGKSAICAPSLAASSSPRESCHAIAGITGSPRASSRIPVSAMLETPSPATRPPGAAASASRAAVSAQSRNPAGAISAPVATVVHSSGAWPWATSSPSSVTTAALHDVVPRSSPSSSSSLIGRTLAEAPRGAGAPRDPVNSAGRLVERVLVLGQVVLGDRHGLRADLLRGRLARERVVGLLDALGADVGRLLGDQPLHGAVLEVLDLLRTGVEADDLGLGARLARTRRRALGGEQVGPEDALEVGVLLERGLHLGGGDLRLVVGVLAPDVVQPGRLGAVDEALLARVRRRDARLDVDDEHLALAADQLGQRRGRGLAAGLVVGGDLRHGHVGLVERRVDEHDLDALVGHLLDRGVERLGVRRRDQHRVGLLRGDRVDDRRLLRRVELLRPLEVECGAQLLGLGLGPAVHRDVELVALDAGDERHLVVLLLRARRRAAAALVVAPAGGDHERERGAQHRERQQRAAPRAWDLGHVLPPPWYG